MKNLIVANWKMNPPSLKEAKELFAAIKKNAKTASASVVVCPPYVYLSQLEGLTLGSQNISMHEKGAFTGQISAGQLKDLGVQYVIVGHSEVRSHGGETDEIVNKKLKVVLENSMTPILCVGEQEGQDRVKVLETQVTAAFEGISKKDAEKVVVAYEPVWAIGTGKNCSPDETVQAALLIKKVLYHMHGEDFSKHVKVLYGGSVRASNAVSYLDGGGVQGFIIGGASLDAEEFGAIVKTAEQ